MVPEGTLGKWSLLATRPKDFGAVAELYATAEAAEARAAALRLIGYTAAVTLSPLKIGD
jgi:hypothetical protein